MAGTDHYNKDAEQGKPLVQACKLRWTANAPSLHGMLCT